MTLAITAYSGGEYPRPKSGRGKPENGKDNWTDEVSMNQPGGGTNAPGRRHRRGRDRRSQKARPRIEPTSPRWSKESGPKICRKCGGRMYPADWIWQQYGLCLGWRCSQCKEKVLARSLPFKGLRKRKSDPDELRDRAKANGQKIEPKDQRQASGGEPSAEGGSRKRETGGHGVAQQE